MTKIKAMEKELIAFRDILMHLKNRRNMYISDTSYSSFTNFIVGYGLGIAALHDFNMYHEFCFWLGRKENKGFSIGWSDYILHYMCEDNEVKAETRALELWNEFIEGELKKVA